MADDLCTSFQAQIWSPEKCKKCFRARDIHGTEFMHKNEGGTTSYPYRSAFRNRLSATSRELFRSASNVLQARSPSSWRKRVYSSDNSDQLIASGQADDDDNNNLRGSNASLNEAGLRAEDTKQIRESNFLTRSSSTSALDSGLAESSFMNQSTTFKTDANGAFNNSDAHSNNNGVSVFVPIRRFDSATLRAKLASVENYSDDDDDDDDDHEEDVADISFTDDDITVIEKPPAKDSDPKPLSLSGPSTSTTSKEAESLRSQSNNINNDSSTEKNSVSDTGFKSGKVIPEDTNSTSSGRGKSTTIKAGKISGSGDRNGSALTRTDLPKPVSVKLPLINNSKAVEQGSTNNIPTTAPKESIVQKTNAYSFSTGNKSYSYSSSNNVNSQTTKKIDRTLAIPVNSDYNDSASRFSGTTSAGLQTLTARKPKSTTTAGNSSVPVTTNDNDPKPKSVLRLTKSGIPSASSANPVKQNTENNSVTTKYIKSALKSSKSYSESSFDNNKTNENYQALHSALEKSVVAGSTSAVSLKKKKLVILKAEVSVDQQPPEEVTMDAQITSESPYPSRPTSVKSGRSRSPDSTEDRSFASAISRGGAASDVLSKAPSFESLYSSLDAKSMVTAISGSISTRSSTPTEGTDDNYAFIRSIKAQLEIMENKCKRLEDENASLNDGSSKGSISRMPSTSAKGCVAHEEVIAILRQTLVQSEGMCQDYRDENTVLKCELREFQDNMSRNASNEVKDLRDKLKAAESLCEEFMEENEDLRRQMTDLQCEIEEMQDQYREEEIDEFRELQKELEQTAKNCRILQFKLRKAERTNDQTEADKQHLVDKVKELMGNPGSAINQEVSRIRELESELRIAKEVSVRLHNELETLEDKRCKLEDDNFSMRERLREKDAREKLIARSGSQRRGSGVSSVSAASGNNSQSMDQLFRDLQDALEREADIKEQLKFAETDLDAANRKVSDLETENEGLMKQLNKFTSGSANKHGRAPMLRSASEGQTQIQLELAEHEASTLKDRLTRTERENERLASHVSLLEAEVRRAGGRTRFTDSELSIAAPDVYYKQKIKILEEEIDDLKIKLESQKVEADQDFGSLSLKRNNRFGSRSRSLESNQSNDSATASVNDTTSQQSVSVPSPNLDLKRQLALIEQEVTVLRQRINDLEGDNEKLNEENKKLQFRRRANSKSGDTSSLSAEEDVSNLRSQIEQMQKDIHRFINRISELEKEKDAFSKEIERRKKLEMLKASDKLRTSAVKINPRTATPTELREKVTELIDRDAEMTGQLKTEKAKAEEFESQLTEYKQILSTSENQRLISMASKVEILSNQLKLSHDRYEGLHKKMQSTDRKRYEDELKRKLDDTEAQLASEIAKRTTGVLKTPTENPPSSMNSKQSDELNDQLKQTQDALATMEQQVEKLYKHLEEIEANQKPTPAKSPSVTTRYRFAANTSGTNDADKEKLLKEVAKVKAEAEQLKKQLQIIRNGAKMTSIETTSSSTTSVNGSLKKINGHSSDEQAKNAKTFDDKDKIIADLKTQLQQAKEEKKSVQHDYSTSNERLLQTEERWNKELEKLKESYENQVKDLKSHLTEAERVRDDKTSLLKERTNSLTDKAKRVSDLENKVTKLDDELKNRHKSLESKMQTEQKRAQEFEIKYQKLETLYETDRQKLTTDREKFKLDLGEMRKKNEETISDLNKLKQTQERKQTLWQKDKKELETQIKKFEDEAKQAELKATRKASEMANLENKKLLAEISQLKAKSEVDTDNWKTQKLEYEEKLELKQRDAEFKLDETDRMKKETTLLKSRVEDQRTQLEDTRKQRDDSREELSRWQQTWTKERSELSHKMRQEEKIQKAEQDAMQLKYESRIKVMEDSSKRFQSELSRTRRERDQLKEASKSLEKKLSDFQTKTEMDEKDLRKRIQKLHAEGERLEDVESELAHQKLEFKTLQKTSDHDKHLWFIEKEKLELRIQELESKQTNTSSSLSTRSNYRRSSSSSLMDPEKEKLFNETLGLCQDLRKQLDDTRTQYDQEIKQVKEKAEKSRGDWLKERQELTKKVKDVQGSLKISEIDRRNMSSTKDDYEQERVNLVGERDGLIEKLHDSEIHQLANKYKLDKVADVLNDVQEKVQYEEIDGENKRMVKNSLNRMIDQLLSVREDMGKTKELGKGFESEKQSNTAGGTALTWKQRNEAAKIIATNGSSAEYKRASTSKGSESPTVEHRKDLSSSITSSMPDKARSISVESVGYEARIAEYRLRSPSPSPRKITNYPDAPPSIVLNPRKSVEYDDSGRYTWKRRSQIVPRSASLEQPSITDKLEIDDVTSDTASLIIPSASHARSLSHAGLNNKLNDNKQTSQSSISSITQSEASKTLPRKTIRASSKISAMANFFERGVNNASSRMSLRSESRTDRSSFQRDSSIESTTSDKRRFFGGKKAKSIEDTNIAAKLGAVGASMLSPGASPDSIPDEIHTKTSTLDSPYKVKKSTSATRLFEKLMPKRGSSLSRQSSGDSAIGVDNSQHVSSFPLDTSKSTSEEHVSIPIQRYYYTSSSSSSIKPLSTSSTMRRSLSRLSKKIRN